MGRIKKKGIDGSFIALPWAVVDCPKYKTLSSKAIALLIELARQYKGNNNGSLVASFSYMQKRGWRSSSTLANALRELKAAGFISETRKGKLNVCALYGLTWLPICPSNAHQITPKDFPFGAYKGQPNENFSSVRKSN